MTRFHSLFLALLFVVGSAHAQTASADTAKAQTTIPDTTKRSASAGIDTLVNYSAKDSIIYSLRTRYMNLYGKSEMHYQTLSLKAERANVNWDNATLSAFGVSDTVKIDSVIGKPVMRDGGEEYKGDEVKYNFRSRKGKITVGNTQMDQGYYVGDQIKKVDPDVLCVANGIYTTCDLKDPHFYFASPKMKVYVHDKVVAEPIYLYVADVPLFALPFGVFPAHSGRSSGLIAPGYGDDNRYGWYLSHLGYYWAASDYWDLVSTFDLYARGRWQNQTNIRYALRYNFGGSITARMTNSPEGEPSDPGYTKSRDYYLNITHGQQISPSSNLGINFTFMNSNYFRNNSFQESEILQQNMLSNATYSKSWESSNRWLSVNVSRDQNLVTDETSEQLPSISFTQGTIFPFRKQTKTRGLSSITPESDLSFAELLGFNYNANFTNTSSKVEWSDSIKTSPMAQSQALIKDFNRTKTQSLSQGMSLSISPKLGYFTVSPSLSFSDTRTWTQFNGFHKSADSLKVDTTNNPQSINGTVIAGVNTSTRFYGMFQPNILGITAFRQTVTPTFGLSYNKQVYGNDMQKYSMLGTFNIGNNFEMKYQKGDSEKTENKLQLLNLSGGFNYNFAADSMKFSEVGINYRTDIGQYLSIGGNASYNLYAYDTAANKGQGGRVNKFLLSEKGKFGDLTSFSLSLSTSFKGDKKQKPADVGIPESVLQEQAAVSGEGTTQPSQQKMYYSIYDREDADFSIPWNVTLAYNFSQSQQTPQSYSRSSTINGSLSFNLTEKWQIATSGSYDFVRKQHFIPSLSVTRDLHCWTMNFSWFPMGTLEGYRFELKVKVPQLQDLKITKQSNSRGNYSY
jgi:lipopolysaccharide assembly outer membrane protein LptD (OstA)